MKKIDTSGIEVLDLMIRKNKKISLVAHIRPDGDAIGSTLAMRGYLAARGCDAAVIYSDMVPETLAFLREGTPDGGIIEFPADNDKAFRRIEASDMIICQDCNSFARTGALEESLRNAKAEKVLIDHHLAPDTAAFNLIFSETEVSSACELLFNILMSMPEIGGDATKLPAVTARALMTGMTTDTNNFKNSVFPSTLEMASSLLAAGVDRDEIISRLYQSGRENSVRLWGYMLYENLKITSDGVAYMILNAETAKKFDLKEGETEGLVNEPLKIDNVRMSIFLKEDGDGFFRVSIRTKKGVSAVKCSASYFHGGGHENASGGRLFFKPVDGRPADINAPEEAEKYIIDKTSVYFADGSYESR